MTKFYADSIFCASLIPEKSSCSFGMTGAMLGYLGGRKLTVRLRIFGLLSLCLNLKG